MTPWQLDTAWPGYAGLGRRMALGRTMIGRSLGTLAATLAIAMVSAFAWFAPGPDANETLVVVFALIAGRYSAQATGVAVRAQRVFAISMAPSPTMQAWRRGWLQSQLGFGLGMSALATAIAARYAGPTPGLLLVAGCIFSGQMIGALTSLAFHGRARQAWLFLPWLAGAGLSIAMARIWPTSGGLGLAVLLGLLSIGIPIPALAVVWRHLGPLDGAACVVASRPALPRLRRFLSRWKPVGGEFHGPSWQPLFVVPGMLVYGSFAVTDYLPARLALLGYFAAAISSTLVIDGLHWRRQLLPGAVQRRRLGGQIFAATLRLSALIVVPYLLVVAAVTAWIGMPPAALATLAASQAMLLVELAFATAAATLLAALFMGRLDELRSWLIIGTAGICLLAATLILRPWGADSPCASWPRAGLGYALALLPAGCACIAIADRLWARRDLVALMRRPRKRWATALGY